MFFIDDIIYSIYTAVDCDVDVRMKDRNGKVIWAENKAFKADDDQWRKFWCGPDFFSLIFCGEF